MKKEITYVAFDGKRFESEFDCIRYENRIKTERTINTKKTMAQLDKEIFEKYFPNDFEGNEASAPDLNIAHIWLTSDIQAVLLKDDINVDEVEEDILNMINSTGYGEEILTQYISMDKIKENVSIRKDFLTALKNVKHGNELSIKLNWAFSENDIQKLAKLHKSNKCRRKIEELLGDCNFHYECGKFADRDYDEFLK